MGSDCLGVFCKTTVIPYAITVVPYTTTVIPAKAGIQRGGARAVHPDFHYRVTVPKSYVNNP